MKKTLLNSLVCGAAFAFSTSVFAVQLGSSVSTTDCPQLNTAVNVNLSSNVFGGYVCRDATVTGGVSLPARIGVGTCHKAGATKPRQETCSRVDTSGDPANPVYEYTPGTCGAGNFDATSGQPLAGDAGKVILRGQSMFTSSTFGGKLAAEDMGTTACDAAGVSGLVETKYPAN